MFERILNTMREKVRAGQYVVTLHAEEEMEADELAVFDIERGMLTGTIVTRQKDRETSEWKYLVKGQTMAEGEIVLVAKLSVTGKLVIITAYRL